MKAFIYEWLDLKRNLRYIGRHVGEFDDGYIGSGTKFIENYSKRPGDFVRSILWSDQFFNDEQVIKKEEEFLDKIHDSELYYGNNRKYYNIVKNSRGFTSINNPMKNKDIVDQMVKTQKENGCKTPWENTVQKYGYEKACDLNKNHMIGNDYGKGNKNKPKSISHKNKIAQSVKKTNEEKLALGISRNHSRPGRPRKMEYSEVLKIVSELGLDRAAIQLNVSREGLRTRYFTALKESKKK